MSRPAVPKTHGSAARSAQGAPFAPGILWLVRHAQPLVAPGVCYGASDMPADETATRAAALVLARELPQGARVRCSPLLRCQQLRDAILQLRPDLGATTDARLAEMDFGCWEGRRWDAIPRSAIDEWTTQFGSWRFGGRESVQDLMDRVAAAWAESLAASGPVAWITHAGVIRAARLLSSGVMTVERSEQWPREAIAFGSHQRVP